MPPPLPTPSAQSQHGLDWLNFFIADVETAFGPFVAVYLSANGWLPGDIGSALTINSAVALATQTPAGALVDWTARKRLLTAACIALIAVGALLIGLSPSYPLVAAGEVLHGVTGGAVPTAIAAMALGLVGHRAFHTRVGRNHRYDSLGNAVTGAGMGVLGYFVSPRAPFLAAAGLCLPALAALGLIRGCEIDYDRARQAEGRREPGAARWHELLRNDGLLVFAGCLFLFQFANASMLP
jgi:MFS family permease